MCDDHKVHGLSLISYGNGYGSYVHSITQTMYMCAYMIRLRMCCHMIDECIVLVQLLGVVSYGCLYNGSEMY